MNLLEKCKNCKLKECIECEYTWSNLKETIENLQKENEGLKTGYLIGIDFDNTYISKDKIREKIENWKPKLEETDRKVEKAKTQEERVVLHCIGLRLDERIKTLEDLLKEE